MIIFTKFHKDRRTIVDFLLITRFWARELFFIHPLGNFQNQRHQRRFPCLLGMVVVLKHPQFHGMSDNTQARAGNSNLNYIFSKRGGEGV